MPRSDKDGKPRRGIPWYICAARILGFVAVFFCILFGLTICIHLFAIGVKQALPSMLQVLVGFFMIAVEAPCCCMFFDQRPLWNRAVLYCIFALPPVYLSPNPSTVFTGGLVFLTGVTYGVISLVTELGGSSTNLNGVESSTEGQLPITDQHSTVMEDPNVCP